MRPRVVITGLGLVTPLGSTVDAFWQALLEGRSGVRSIQAFDASSLPTRIAGEVRGFDCKEYIDKKERKSLKVMARPIQMAVAATTLALRDAKIGADTVDPLRFGIDFGAGLIASELDELGPAAAISANGVPGHVDMAKWGTLGLAAMPPLWMLKYLPNMLACHVSILNNCQGPNNTITETDVASILALGEAYQIIRRGQADVMLAGSADSKVNPLSMTRWSLFQPLSQRNDAPEKASRPFDRQRDGLVPGEGSGILVLEEFQHAQKRGAPIHAEVVGFGASFDTRRNGDGLARAIQMALRHADIAPADVDHVNAQGFSTRREDNWEARGIHKVFGTTPVPVFAGKSYFGSLGAASGGVELATSVLALKRGVLPPTLNHDEADPECPIKVHSGKLRDVQKPYVLKTSFTEMGQCAAVIVKKSPEC